MIIRDWESGTGWADQAYTDTNGWTGLVIRDVRDESGNMSREGVLCGSSYTLQRDLEIPADCTLTIAAGQTLTVPAGVTLTNSGTIAVETGGNIVGAVNGNQPVLS